MRDLHKLKQDLEQDLDSYYQDLLADDDVKLASDNRKGSVSDDPYSYYLDSEEASQDKKANDLINSVFSSPALR